MYKESQLVPFQTSLLPEGTSLIFSPHPDDETFGLGGTISKMTKQGQRVIVVLMTDGSKAGSATIRKKEFKSATDMLGVTRTYDLNFIDKEIQTDSESINKICKIILKETPDNVFFTSPMEYHTDHRVTAWLVWSCLKNLNFQGNIYTYEVGNQSPFNTLIDITSEINEKKSAMACYKSQNEFNDYERKIISINESRTYTLPKSVKYAEAIFKHKSIENDLLTDFYNYQMAFEKGLHINPSPLISILIRTKNRPEHLRNAIHSIVRQTYKNIEINCLNDGGESVKSITNSFSPHTINVLENEFSRGRAAAANQLLDMATGDYLIFLDDDDTFDNNHIESLVNELKKHPSVEVIYSGVRVGSKESPIKNYNHPYSEARLRYENYIPIHAVLFSKCLVENSCRFDETLEIYEDWDFWLQLSQQASFLHLDKITATYNIYGTSGAGESGNKIDRRVWKLKLYEKWLASWSGSKLDETFNEIKRTNSSNTQNFIRSEHQILKQLSEKDREISSLKKNIKNTQIQVEKQKKRGDNIITQFINSNIPEKNNTYRIKPGMLHSKECRELFESVFSQKMPIEFWDWKYKGAHWRTVCAIDENKKVIGFYGGTLRRIMAFNEPRLALQACDTMIHKKARTNMGKNGLFYSLYSTWESINFNHNSDLFIGYGFPHNRVFNLAKKLGIYEEADKIYKITWKLSNPLSSKVNSYPVADESVILSLWEEMKSDFKEKILTIRDKTYINERYINHPKNTYIIEVVKDDLDKKLGIFILKESKNSYDLVDIISSKINFPTVINQACFTAQKLEKKILTAWTTESCRDLFKTPISTISETSVVIPSVIPKGKNYQEKIKGAWFLMYGDTDFF